VRHPPKNPTATESTHSLELLNRLGFGPETVLMNEPKLFVDGRFLASLLVELEDELNEILDNYLTAAQTKAYKKLDETAQKHVKDAMLRNVILSAWDQNDEKFVAVVKAEVKEAMASAKQL